MAAIGMMKGATMCNVVLMAGLVLTLVLNEAVVPSQAAIGCNTVVTSVLPCVPYLTQGAPLANGCCDGVKSLNNAAQSTPDRQSVCKCLKTLAGSVSGIDLGKAEGLPSKCGVNIPYKISLSTDCSKVI